VGIVLNHTEGSSLIRLEGIIDIGVAAELKAALLEAVATGNSIHVSIEAVSELDVTAFQLLWAASREAMRSGVDLVLAGEMPGPVRNALSEIGLDVCGLFACARAVAAADAGPEIS